jgi:DNA-binding protein H-NS
MSGGTMIKATQEDLRAMSVEELLQVRRQIDAVLSERREELERQLEQIVGHPPKQNTGNSKVILRYRSKKDPSQVWSGRGVLPRWMRDEIKGTKLTKADFLIKR